ncbi:GlxA family transcriptional regulator [Pseudonocardia sp. CA-142604]|uniref:GlxA family transcriptional regulator n=1 Tax=Pseudonocardia sp. CA-142604 TaxID=3240024 RepID=UPI003D8CC2D1
MVPTLGDPLTAQCPKVLEAVAEAGETGARMISLCTGAFVLGQAGLLDGRRVATHWSWTTACRAAFPRAELEENTGFVDDGQILSSACMPATTELCLHVLSVDLGRAYAEAVARLLIHKSGDASLEQQARAVPVPRQTPVPRTTNGSLGPLLRWLTEHLHEPLDVERIADRAHLSARTLTRHFRTQTGTTPTEWILRQRIEAARSLLEDTDLTVLQVARRAGFGTAETMRRAFTRRLGISPRDYRIAIRGHSGFDHTPHPGASALHRADFTSTGRAGLVPSRPDSLRLRSGRTYSSLDSQCTDHQTHQMGKEIDDGMSESRVSDAGRTRGDAAVRALLARTTTHADIRNVARREHRIGGLR